MIVNAPAGDKAGKQRLTLPHTLQKKKKSLYGNSANLFVVRVV